MMNPKKFVLVLLVFSVACGGSKLRRDQQQQYDVVQEGSADGVTSTINAPGETTQPLTSSTITGTNIDTTTAFTLPGTATTTAQQPGTVAGTLPTTSGGFPGGYIPRPKPQPKPEPQTTTNPPPEGAPPTTDTVAPTTTSTSATDTTATSTQAPEKSKKDENPPPPPPTRTDTIGGHTL